MEPVADITTDLPLLSVTPRSWAERAASRLPEFLADHAVCEQQAALFALNLVAHYPDDAELQTRLIPLAAEEVTHLRRVVRLLHRRGHHPARRRPNRYVQGLHSRIRRDSEAALKTDRLLVGALIEARSCERFTRLLEVIGDSDPEVRDLLHDLGPAERRHWELFRDLAARTTAPAELEARFGEWLAWERQLMSERGVSPEVHG